MANMKSFIKYSCLIVLAISVLVLIAWALGFDVITRISPDLPAMNPLTAVGLALSSTWMLLFGRHERHRLLLAAIAIVVLVLGILRAFDFTDVYIPIVNIAGESILKEAAVSPPTMLNFSLFGITMILSLLLYPKYRNIVAFTAPFVLFICLLSLFGYLVGENKAFVLKPYMPMALHTTVCFIALSISLLFLFPKNSFIEAICSGRIGGYSARVLLPYVIFVPFVLGLLNYYGQRADLYEPHFGIGIAVASMILIFLFIIWRLSRILNRVDAEKDSAYVEVKSANERLAQSHLQLEQFIFIASHDLKEPLRKIMTFGDMLSGKSAHMSQRERDLIHKIINAAGRTSLMLTEIADYTHLMHQRLDFETVALNDVLQEVVSDFEVSIAERSASIIVHELPRVNAVRFQLTQLFSSLLGNALKFYSPERPLEVIVTSGDASEDDIRRSGLDTDLEYYCISFSDNGIGFDQKYADKAFRMFERLHDDFQGYGMGLAICRRVAQNHQGEISVRSVPGKGTTFSIFLRKKAFALQPAPDRDETVD
jgi:signal transduction histidine kinase